jgi:hypothetical protein
MKTNIVTESYRTETSAGADPFQFNIEAIYVPETVPIPSPKTEISKRTAR